jgi:Na+-translocating ferredoxin:NAD+ oxidoreductase RnfA subunit
MLPQDRKTPLLRTIKAVLWSFIGLRSRAEFNKDLVQLNPIHLIAVGLVLAIVFVLGLAALVNWVVNQPVTL